MTAASVHHPPGARALYLGGGTHKRVAHTHEALVVTNAAGQTLRYPLTRLARVVSSAAVDWDGGALALCLQHGISITWADGKGNPLGSASPCRAKHMCQADTLELLLEQPDGTEHYQNWHRSRRMQVLTHWRRTDTAPTSPLDWEQTKREWVYGNRLRAHLPLALQGHCHAWVAAQLQQHQLPNLLWDAQGNDIQLAHDLTQLLWAEMNLCSGPVLAQCDTERELTDLFEHWQTTNGAALNLHLGALLRVAKSFQYP